MSTTHAQLIRRHYRDVHGIHREIWMPGDGDGTKRDLPISGAAPRDWRFVQSSIGPLDGKGRPPRYVLLDDRAAWEIHSSGLFSKSQLQEYWRFDFNAQGVMRAFRPNRGRPAYLSKPEETGGTTDRAPSKHAVHNLPLTYKDGSRYHLTGQPSGYMNVNYPPPERETPSKSFTNDTDELSRSMKAKAGKRSRASRKEVCGKHTRKRSRSEDETPSYDAFQPTLTSNNTTLNLDALLGDDGITRESVELTPTPRNRIDRSGTLHAENVQLRQQLASLKRALNDKEGRFEPLVSGLLGD